MEKIISCCGIICSECKAFPKRCKGCPQEKGQIYWLQYVEKDCCPIYQCCVNEKQLKHCGECESLVCEKWREYIDPAMSEEECQKYEIARLELLKSLLIDNESD